MTGDVVTLTRGAGNRDAVAIAVAPRSDGSRPSVSVSNRGDGDVYAIPDDVASLVDTGRLDAGLFDVTYLAGNGYDDTASLPVIVAYARQLTASDRLGSARLLRSASVTAELESIDAVAMAVDTKSANVFWDSLSDIGPGTNGIGSAGLRPSVAKVWLDRRTRMDLHESVPMIGAPQVWASGYDGSGVKVAVLDTGADDTHPDLAGQVTASASFVPGQGVRDHNGHGTHVASILAGTGHGSGGKYTGVAPGAALAIGKILDDDGAGLSSWMIDGMEWAATTEHADVVNLSLGSGPSDGTDPASLAVDRLTEQTGALFVVAAGNGGPGASTVGAPGVADAALTVGAVDKADRLADFSSRGPRTDSAMKPDITAPGLGIVAARAAGTNLGTPVDARYTSLSGTSMATPHVAGAAALLIQRHPDWKPAALKAALMSTAKDDGYSADEQGAGRVDVAAAARQLLVAETGSAGFGAIAFDERPVARQRGVSISNAGDQPVTVQLTADLRRVEGGPSVDGALSVPEHQTMPAHRSSEVTIALNAAGLPSGRYTGSVTISSPAGERLRIPIGYTIEPQLYDVTVTISRRSLGVDPVQPGPRCASAIMFELSGNGTAYRDHRVCWTEPAPRDHSVVFRAPAGVYFIRTLSDWSAGGRLQQALLIEPGARVDGDTEIRLDADLAQHIALSTPRPAEADSQWLTLTARAQGGGSTTFTKESMFGSEIGWVTPVEASTAGSFTLAHHWMLAAPRLELSVEGPGRPALHPFAPYYGNSLPFSGSRKLPIVSVGHGSAEDFARVSVSGSLVLMRLEDPNRPIVSNAQLQRALDAGASGVLFDAGHADVQRIGVTDPHLVPQIPWATLPGNEAESLAKLLSAGGGELAMQATPPGNSPYLYTLKPYETNRIPEGLDYHFTPADLATVTMTLPAAEPSTTTVEWMTTRATDEQLRAVVYGPVPTRRTIAVASGPLYRDAVHTVSANGEDGYYLLPDRRHIEASWGSAPVAPGVPDPGIGAAPADMPRTQLGCSGCRQRNTFFPVVALTQADRHDAGALGAMTGDADVHLYRDGLEVPKADPWMGDVVNYELSPERARYHLTIADEKTSTAWDFSSSEVTDDETPPGFACVKTLLAGSTAPCRPEPLIFLRYDAGLGLDNAVRNPGVQDVRITAHRQAGHGPQIEGLTLEVSYDGGRQWTPVAVTAKPAGGVDRDFVGLVHNPRRTGEVSLRAVAWDAEGNRIEQTLYDAYRLR
ncbi:S8 family serine peptidase [Kribbella sp. VKM Ac-2571]|uniref:S8 family serine peptidase n=1 Tax=Kribbella sp. VKM Ac-2571 TaxID=2512222 RepID=UPI001414F594|nr:S8 family serine peptidase [Kribbella sp. VKM Ac-2571]